ncbi:3'-5' exonuclease [Azospira restricta]|uniref:3'-5' exonuclease domain-containing protein 2 n=1 Tax=Azospira restricta TaxID=404405 RepID=A0A974Y3K3_9RHOO|nr:3'-5' exonuclease [Azospira restricta]QRJ63948.1 3'-5' exonuclease domain-containing protein 2 [Azospira restricta]
MPSGVDRAALAAAELPPYPGIALADVTLVDSAARAEAAQAALLAADAVGFDTESKPTFLKGEVSTGPHLVQLATDGHVWLFPTALPAGVAALKAVLESPRVKKIGFGLGNDRSALQARLGVAIANLLDLGEVLRGPGHRGTVGAKMAVAHFFGQRLQKSKKTGTSNWASPRLSERQLLYAANDAHVALRVYRAWAALPG